MEGFIDRIGVWRYGVLMEWLPLELVLMLDGHSRWRCSWLLMLDVPGPWMKARGESCNGFFPTMALQQLCIILVGISFERGRRTPYILLPSYDRILYLYLPTCIHTYLPTCGCTSWLWLYLLAVRGCVGL